LPFALTSYPFASGVILKFHFMIVFSEAKVR
jgi:hypothetical protein